MQQPSIAWRVIAAAAGAGLAAALICAGPPARAQLHPCPLVVSSAIPGDECGGAFRNSPELAMIFAWNSFIALNWPALGGVRDTPDTGKTFGANVSPVVWETMRAKVEIYPGNGNRMTGPHGATIAQQPPYNATNPPDFGYDAPPKYVYSPFNVGTPDGQVAPCTGQSQVAQTSWIPLDETTQIQINQTFAGTLPATPTNTNSAPQLIRYMVKMNRALYDTIVANQFWYKGPPLNTAMTNFQKALAAGQTKDPNPPFVQFSPPTSDLKAANTIEVKAAWRPLTDDERSKGRFHTATVRYYEMNGNVPCYREDDKWGLIGLHIITKTPSAPWLIWATFEQADNILDQNRNRVEDADGNNVSPQPRPTPTSPPLQSNPNSPNPTVTFVNPDDSYCTTPGARLFFRENPADTGLPSGGNICVNQRWHPIPPEVIKVNAMAHQAIKTYLAQNGMTDSPWLYYKLINVQPVPFDKSEVGGLGGTDPGTYYTANAVIETDYTLGVYSGRLASTGAPSDVNQDGSPFNNVRFLPFQGEPDFKTPLNMGGCTGCHASSALKGTEFSFSLVQSSVRSPERPNPFAGAQPMIRDRALFAPMQ
ncbi:MAG TPA: hypothetical protein VEM36_13670 [Xanthobacteraceae bacterium]|nr:hypothetical protein [Xanthobacteraceae bacterium]